MKILLTTRTMGYLSGAAIHTHSIAYELAKHHQVTVLSSWLHPYYTDHNAPMLKLSLQQVGVECVDTIPRTEYDLTLVSQPEAWAWLPNNLKGKIVNVVHSYYKEDAPIEKGPHEYIAIRPDIKIHLIRDYAIPAEKIHVIYNGVDRQRFKKMSEPVKHFFKIVVPCTLDRLREKFLNHLIVTANEDRRIFIYGLDCGAKLHKNSYVQFFPPQWNIEYAMADAHIVAGILLGRVNLEARSMGIASLMYDPKTLHVEPFQISDEDFDARHNIANVCKQIIALADC